MKYYLIFKYDYEVYVHEFNSRKEALNEYESFKRLTQDECKIILAKGKQSNMEVR